MSAEPSAAYTERYYLESCGGGEFFKRYGAKVVKPAAALALKRADLAPGMTALDLGCGRGELLYQLKERGVRAYGADFSAAALGIAKKTGGAPVLRCDGRKLPFQDAAFDRIFFLGVLDHLTDQDLEACFAEFKRVLRPGGLVLANTCVNAEYYKTKTFLWRRSLANLLRLPAPRPPRSAEDAELHVNEHDLGGLRRFFDGIGWDADVEARPNDKYAVDDLYGPDAPKDLPIRRAAAWKRWYLALVFRGPWKRFLAREFFCVARPKS